MAGDCEIGERLALEEETRRSDEEIKNVWNVSYFLQLKTQVSNNSTELCKSQTIKTIASKHPEISLLNTEKSNTLQISAITIFRKTPSNTLNSNSEANITTNNNRKKWTSRAPNKSRKLRNKMTSFWFYKHFCFHRESVALFPQPNKKKTSNTQSKATANLTEEGVESSNSRKKTVAMKILRP